MVWLQRKETWAGDRRANIIRLIVLGLFTANEMINFHILHVVDKTFHVGSLVLVALWVLAAVGFSMISNRHWLPRSAAYIIVSIDVFLLTWLLFLANGPKSPLVGVYFLIVALSTLRLNPRLVLFSAAISALGYLSAWDFARHQHPEYVVPVYHLVIVGLCLIIMGFLLCHAINRVFFLMGSMTEREPR